MKKLLSLLIFFPLLLPASPVSRRDAESSAVRFLESRGISESTLKIRNSHGVRKSKAADEECPYYVFDYGKGVVIASADDRLPAILGYTTSPNTRPDFPPALEAWLADYEDYTARLDKLPSDIQKQNAPQRNRQEQPALADHAPIAPIITTQWYQREPYNLTCPVYPGTELRSVTGCVATAMAQAMSHYRYPSHTTKAIPKYTYTGDYQGVQTKITVPALPDHLFIDWDNILDFYDDEHPHSPVNDTAIANFMMYVGKAVKMTYTPSGSGAYSVNSSSTLRNYFGYPSTVIHHQRETFSNAEWDELIYNEIANNRPVVYHGSTTTGGHAYIVDGYDSDGYYHLNWGWGGAYDGYFLLDVLNPRNNDKTGASSTREGYVISSGATIGIDTIETVLAPPRLMIGLKSSTEDSLYYSSRNYTNCPTHFDIGIALLNEEGDIASILDSHLNIDYANTSSLNHGFALNLHEAGTYQIAFVSRITDTEQWNQSPNVNNNGAILTVIIDTEGKATVQGKYPHIDIKQINVIGPREVDSLHTIDVLIRNIGCGSYVNPLYLHYRSEDGLDVDTVSQTVWLEANENVSRWVHIGFTPKTWGKYKLYIQTSSEPTPEDILDSLEIDIQTPSRASVKVGTKTTVYPTLQQAIDYAVTKKNPTVKLLCNINMNADTLNIRSQLSKHKLVLDLNGFKIEGKSPTLLYMRPRYTTASVDIVDNSTEGTGRITNSAAFNGVIKTVYLYKGTINLKGGTIEANNKLAYSSANKSVKALAVYVRPGYNFNMTGGEIIACSTRYALGIGSYGNIDISAGTIDVQETASGRAYALYVLGGTAHVSGSAVINANATSYAIGAYVGGGKPSTSGKLYNGELIIDGGTFNVNAETKAFGIAVTHNSRGELVDAGYLLINNGLFNVSVQQKTAYGIYLQKELQVNDAVATPQAVIKGGYFMITGPAGLKPINTYATPDALTFEGGFFNRASYISRYTAPTKDCNYQLVKLGKKEEAYKLGYRYKIVEIADETADGAAIRMMAGSEKTDTDITLLPEEELTEGPLRVYDALGRLVLSTEAGNAADLNLTPGIYILQTGAKTRKIAVQ